MRFRLKLGGLALFAAVALAGCATFQTPTRSNPDNGAIFGYFDIPSDSYGSLQSLSILRYPGSVRPYIGIPNDVPYVIHDGAFFAYNAKPGQYYVMSIFTYGGGLFGNKQYQMNLLQFKFGDPAYNEKLLKENLITVKPQELHYLGAAKVYVGKHEGLLSNGSFSIGPDEKITEKQVIEKLLPALKGTPWEKPVNDLYASLK
ncbi:MAG TPA: hypothetical protein VMV68_04600 [Spirochaetia bacterium]|nr:hypothetical protein [Spirochaetia bacterium]